VDPIREEEVESEKEKSEKPMTHDHMDAALQLVSGCVSEMSQRFEKLQQYSAMIESVEKEQK